MTISGEHFRLSIQYCIPITYALDIGQLFPKFEETNSFRCEFLEDEKMLGQYCYIILMHRCLYIYIYMFHEYEEISKSINDTISQSLLASYM